ncbi:MAG: carbamoyltransferase [Candidatus Omnitrophota bacterium]
MQILGVSCFYHDAAAAILKDGVLLAAAEEERFSRKKHDFDFPINAINFCLDAAGLGSKDLDYVIFYEKPFIKFERILLTTIGAFPRSWGMFRESMITWLLDKLWIKQIIHEKLGVPSEKILFSEHHMSHAASAYLCSPFDKAAIITVDGVGEWATATLGKAEGNNITILKEIRFPHSLGLLYSAFTAFLGFEVNEGEYKVMGMAPYGEPKYVDKVYKLIESGDDGAFWLNMKYFSFHYSTSRTFNKRFAELFGNPRDHKLHFFTPSSGYPEYFGPKPKNYEELASLNQHYADIAASIQRVTEEIILKMANYLYKETHFENLCIGGGVGLNCVANGRILRESEFKRIYVQPAAGDGGAAIGAAFYLYNSILNNPRRFVLNHVYWGQDYSNSQIKKFLEENKIKYEYIENDDRLFEKTADYLIEGKVVGWFQGRFEWGPRALGNRSILADARRQDMKDVINTKIKFREPYRPFAPSVLAEMAEEFFELEDSWNQPAARFMLLVTPVKVDKKSLVPAITHVDGSARPQLVFKDINPRYYKMIERFYQKTGVPLVLNTSFNLKGEPIVNTPSDAYSTFIRSGMDRLVLGNFIISRPN